MINNIIHIACVALIIVIIGMAVVVTVISILNGYTL